MRPARNGQPLDIHANVALRAIKDGNAELASQMARESARRAIGRICRMKPAADFTCVTEFGRAECEHAASLRLSPEFMTGGRS